MAATSCKNHFNTSWDQQHFCITNCIKHEMYSLLSFSLAPSTEQQLLFILNLPQKRRNFTLPKFFLPADSNQFNLKMKRDFNWKFPIDDPQFITMPISFHLIFTKIFDDWKYCGFELINKAQFVIALEISSSSSSYTPRTLTMIILKLVQLLKNQFACFHLS